MVQDRDKMDGARRWAVVFAIARTWTTVEEKSLKQLVPHVPHPYDQRTRGPSEGRKGRRTFGTYHTHWSLRHGGDVPVLLSKLGRNMGAKQTPILGTNRAEVTPSQVVGISQRRWAVDLMPWARTAGAGLGAPPVSGGQRAQRDIPGNRRTGLLVGAARVSSRECAWHTLESCSASACSTVTGHDEPRRASGEGKDGKGS